MAVRSSKVLALEGRRLPKPETFTFDAGDVTVYLAAAGAGKTTALMNEMTKLLTVYRPDEIAFVTYTRKGVAHGIERALQANPQLSVDDLIYFRTLHALCFRELGLAQSSIITWRHLDAFNNNSKYSVTLHEAFEGQTEDDVLLTRYDVKRNGGTEDMFTCSMYDAERYKELTGAYEVFKEHHHLVDFYDCLTRFCDRAQPVNVKAAFIDEAQDLTLLQWEVCRIAFSACEKIIIAGDDFQSLFTYAGASPQTLICLSEKYRKQKLETSYRLPGAVYRFARGITTLMTCKIEKDFRPAKDFEGFVEDVGDRYALALKIQSDLKENGMISGRWYLLFRNNCFIEDAAGELERLFIPYHTSRGFFIDTKDLAKIKRYYNFRKKGFEGSSAFEAFCTKYRIEHINAPFIESDLIPSERKYVYLAYVEAYGITALEEMSQKEPYVLLSTTHRVKGGEADFAAVFLDCTYSTYCNGQLFLDEELRVLYVACSRARNGLYLVPSKGRYSFAYVTNLAKEMAA